MKSLKISSQPGGWSKNQQIAGGNFRALLLCLFTAMVKLGSARALIHPRLRQHHFSQTLAQPTSTVTLRKTMPLLSLSSHCSLTSVGLTHLHTRRAFLHSSFKPSFFFLFFTKRQHLQRSPCPTLKQQFLSLPGSIYRKPHSHPAQTWKARAGALVLLTANMPPVQRCPSLHESSRAIYRHSALHSLVGLGGKG